MTETIGQRLRRIRKDLRLTSYEVAAQINMSPSHVRRVETNEHAPGLYMAAELAKVYGVSLDYIAGLTDRETNPYVRRGN